MPAPCAKCWLLLLAASSSLFGSSAGTANFTYQVGGAVPPAQYFSITATVPSQQATGLTLRTSGQSWVLAQLSSTVTPATLTISVNPAGLSVGNYTATVEVANSASALEFYVNLTVLAQLPRLSLSQSGFTFTVSQGAAVQPSQALTVGATTPGVMVNSSNAAFPRWLRLTNWSAAATAPFTVQVSVDATGLDPGTYTAAIPFTTTPDNAVSALVTLIVTTAPPILKVSSNQLLFPYLLGTAAPAAQTVRVDSTGAPLSVVISLTAPWISASTLNGVTPLNLDLNVNPAGLAMGTYRGQAVITTTPFLNPSTQFVDVVLTITPDERPVVTAVLNAGSFKAVIGPGMWISIMGSNFSKSIAQATSTYLSTSLNGVSAQLRGAGGLYNLLVHYVSPTQVNAFVPHEVGADFFNSPSTELVVLTPTGTASVPVICQALAPALFTYGTARYAAAIHPDGVIVGTIPGTTPAKPGSVISLYGTGFGQTTPPVSNVNGPLTPRPLASDVVISIEGHPVKLLWAGMVGIGLYQFNVELPSDLPDGDHALTIQIAGITTEGVNVTFKQ